MRRPALFACVLGFALGLSCSFGVDPDLARFSCETSKDCGSGFECRPQARGGAICFREGLCTDEVCDGWDNDCDGQADEDFDFFSNSQHCGGCNAVCAAGTHCVNLKCRELSCADGLDNNSDQLVDCAEENCLGQSCSTADAGLNCGNWGMDTPDAGVSGSCVARESSCDNGLDDDGDRAADCVDDDCAEKACAPGKTCQGGQCR